MKRTGKDISSAKCAESEKRTKNSTLYRNLVFVRAVGVDSIRTAFTVAAKNVRNRMNAELAADDLCLSALHARRLLPRTICSVDPARYYHQNRNADAGRQRGGLAAGYMRALVETGKTAAGCLGG
jgi:hypothetical protein